MTRFMNVTARRRGLSWACMILAVLVATAASGAPETSALQAGGPRQQPVQAQNRSVTMLRPENTIGDLLAHPAFAGFAERILPWDDRAYDERMPLSDFGSLLPYHSNVRPREVVSGLNRMIADMADGKTVFLDIYSDAEKRELPARRNAGLFFFRGRPGAPFAVIAPGGGFAYVGSVHEGFPYAEAINREGYNAFVLRYRAGQGGRVATEDLAAALAYVFRNAAALDVGTAGYSLWGSSAGARMAASIGSHGTAAFDREALPTPAAVIMAYTGHSDTSSEEPPTFAIVGARDAIVPPSAMQRRIETLRRAGVPVELHVIDGLGHGFGTGEGTPAAGWISKAVRFWETVLPRPLKG